MKDIVQIAIRLLENTSRDANISCGEIPGDYTPHSSAKTDKNKSFQNGKEYLKFEIQSVFNEISSKFLHTFVLIPII